MAEVEKRKIYSDVQVRNSEGEVVNFIVSSGLGGLLTVGYDVSMLENGELYIADDSDVLATAETLIMAFITPDSDDLLHVSFEANIIGGGATAEIMESPTITGATGTQESVYNKNRSSSNTSLIRDIDGVVNKVTLNPTITDVGTIFRDGVLSANKQGGNAIADDFFVLKSNTQYALRITANDNGITVQSGIVFFSSKIS